MLEVQEINQIEALGDFRQAWRKLLAETTGGSFFHSLEWLECYWTHFGAEQKLRVLVVGDGGRPIGIVPLVVRPETTRVGRMRTLGYPLNDWASFFSPIGPSPAATLAAGLRHVRRTPRDWDVVDLRWIDADGCDLACTEQTMTDAGFRPCKQKWNETSLIELPETWREYWYGRDPKFRRNVDRVQRRMAEQGKLEYVRARGACGAGFSRQCISDQCTVNSPPESSAASPSHGDLYEACVALAQRSWQGERGDRTSLCHSQYGEFFRAAHAVAADRGVADINLLCFDGHPVAFFYNYCWKGAVFGLRRGFDPEFARLSPGLILQKLMLEDGHGRGDRLYDLGTGTPASKVPWRTSVRANYRFTFFPAMVLRAQLLRWNRWLRRQIRGKEDVACST